MNLWMPNSNLFPKKKVSKYQNQGFKSAEGTKSAKSAEDAEGAESAESAEKNRIKEIKISHLKGQ